jgi:hypothetical protein
METMNSNYGSFSWMQMCMMAFALVVSVVSCNKENAPDCFQSAGEFTTTERGLDNFVSVELNDYIQYELYDTAFYGVIITAPRNLIPDIQTEVKGGKLIVHNRNTCNFVRSFKKKIIVRICSPNFTDIQNYSTGDIRTVNTIQSGKFLMENRHAAGVHQLMMDADTIDIRTHAGVCDVILEGRADAVFLFNQGLGILDARAVNAVEAFVNNSSVNKVFVNSTGYLYSVIYSSGSVYYSGSPTLIDSDIQGQGQLLPL